jgi:hypothetical protein
MGRPVRRSEVHKSAVNRQDRPRSWATPAGSVRCAVHGRLKPAEIPANPDESLRRAQHSSRPCAQSVPKPADEGGASRRLRPSRTSREPRLATSPEIGEQHVFQAERGRPELSAMQGKLEVPREPSKVARAGLGRRRCHRSADRAQKRWLPVADDYLGETEAGLASGGPYRCAISSLAPA